MSDHYEVVFSCFLLDGTPDHVLNTLRWHLGLLDEGHEGVDPEDLYGRLLLPDPHTHLPGREFAALSLQDGGWGLHSRNYWLDDDIGWVFELLELIAPTPPTMGTAASSATSTRSSRPCSPSLAGPTG